jgi:hypothetical protein
LPLTNNIHVRQPEPDYEQPGILRSGLSRGCHC